MFTFVTSDFGKMCRELRVRSRLKQREVAAKTGMAASTYGNVESSPNKVIRRERAEAIGKSYGLTPDILAQLMAAWEAQPISEYSKNQREKWAVRNASRSKVKGYDKMALSLNELATLVITTSVEPEKLCSCTKVDMFAENPEPEFVCELCNALHLLGVPTGYTNASEVIEKLAKIQDGLTG